MAALLSSARFPAFFPVKMSFSGAASIPPPSFLENLSAVNGSKNGAAVPGITATPNGILTASSVWTLRPSGFLQDFSTKSSFPSVLFLLQSRARILKRFSVCVIFALLHTSPFYSPSISPGRSKMPSPSISKPGTEPLGPLSPMFWVWNVFFLALCSSEAARIKFLISFA